MQSPTIGSGAVVTGTTRSGDFVSEVNGVVLAVTGQRTFPPARSVTLEQALTGAEYAEWIEMQGYLRSVTLEGRLARLELMTSGGEFVAAVPISDLPETLTGALVQIRAVCDVMANERHQLVGVRLWVPSPKIFKSWSQSRLILSRRRGAPSAACVNSIP